MRLWFIKSTSLNSIPNFLIINCKTCEIICTGALPPLPPPPPTHPQFLWPCEGQGHRGAPLPQFLWPWVKVKVTQASIKMSSLVIFFTKPKFERNGFINVLMNANIESFVEAMSTAVGISFDLKSTTMWNQLVQFKLPQHNTKFQLGQLRRVHEDRQKVLLSAKLLISNQGQGHWKWYKMLQTYDAFYQSWCERTDSTVCQ